MTSTHKTSGNIIEKLLAFNFIGGTSVPLIRRSIFEQLNGFDVELLSSQDYDLWIRIAKQGLVYYVDHPMIIRYFSNESVTTDFEKKDRGGNT